MSSIHSDVQDTQVEADAHAASEGDLEALGRLYERYADPLKRFLVSRTRGNEHLADDVAGETWVKVATSIANYTSKGGGFPAWLFTIGKRLLVSQYRASSSRSEHLAPGLLSAELWVEQAPGPEANAEAAEAKLVIAHAIEKLPATQRRCVILHYWVGLSLSETAATMGKTPGAAAMLHQRAMRTLGPILASYSPRNFDSGTLVALGDSERATEQT